MASRPSSFRASRRSSPQPMASGSRSRNQEERRHQGTRGRSRSRSPRHERWVSNPPGGQRAPPMSASRSRMRSRTPPSRINRPQSSVYQYEDRGDRREGGSHGGDRNNRSPAVRRRRVERVSENNWRTRARSSPPAETRGTRGRSRSLSPHRYHSRQRHHDWQERGAQGGRQGYDGGGRRSQSSDVSMRSPTPPFPRDDGRGRDASRGEATSHPSQVQDQVTEIPWNNYPRIPSQGDAYVGLPMQNYGTTKNIGTAGNVFTGTNYGVINMTIAPADDFMLNLSSRLNVCKRADHRYYALEDEANLRRGQCTPGTHVNILQGITQWATNMTSHGERVFWLSGQAGSGKTTIAYTIACYFEALVSNVLLGASFFCSRQYPDTRSASSIVRTIVYQLAVRSKPFQAALKQHGKFETVDHDPKSQIVGLLITPWQESAVERLANKEPCYVIPIDALDELDGTGGTEFLGTLFDVVDQQDLSGLKFFVTSRSDPALVRRIASFPNKKVCRLEEVPLEESSADIRLYLSKSLTECATAQQIQQLVSDAAGLFIYAATVVEYVKGRNVEEQKSLLRRLLSPSSSSSVRRPSRAATATLDNLYLQILETSLVDPRERGDPETFQDCLAILHTFLCTIERTSTSVAIDILNSSGADGDMLLDTGMAEGVLHRLHAVLYSQGGHVMSYHKSFADFLFDKGRSQRFFCNQEQHHHRLFDGCSGIMMRQLRFNIADIASSYMMDRDNPTLATCIDANISAALRYACGNWSSHLTLTGVEILDGFIGTLDRFLRLQVLFWMEVMNLLGQQGQCPNMLRDIQRWITKSKDSTGLGSKLADAAVLAAYHSMSKAVLSTPHFYLSSLATFPRRSAAVQNWRQQFHGIPGFTAAQTGGSEALVARINVGNAVNALAVSRDGANALVGSPDGSVQIWDLFTQEEVRALKGHTEAVLAVAYSPDGTRAVSGSGDNSVRVWDLSTGENVWVRKGHTGSVNAVAYSPDSMHVLSGSSDGLIRVWDLSSGGEVGVLRGHTESVNAVAYAPDGTRVVSGSNDKSVRVWDLSTRETACILNGHTEWVLAVAYSPNGTHVVSGSDDETVRVWNLSAGEAVRILKGHRLTVLTVVYSLDGSHVASGSDDSTLRVWDLSTGEAVRVLEDNMSSVKAVAYLPDGTLLSGPGRGDALLRVWDVTTEEALVPRGHTESVNAVAYAPDGTRVVSGSDDNSVWVWDLSTREVVCILNGHTGFVQAVAYSPAGAYVVSGSSDKSVRVWDLSTGEVVRVLKGNTLRVLSVAYSPDGSHVASGAGDGSIRIWGASTGEEERVLRGHTWGVGAVVYSPDGSRIISGSVGNSIRVWDSSTGEEVRVLRGQTGESVQAAVAVSPDGTRVVSTSMDRSARVWDLSTGDDVRVLQGHAKDVTAVAYLLDGTRVVSGSFDKSVRVWNLDTGDAVRILLGHTGAVLAVVSSPDGTHIVSGSFDHSVRVWDISPEHTPRYVREEGPNDTYTGWLVSPTDPSAYLMFVRPEALLPDDSNVLTFPATAVSHLNLSNAKLGDRWAECFTPSNRAVWPS